MEKVSSTPQFGISPRTHPQVHLTLLHCPKDWNQTQWMSLRSSTFFPRYTQKSSIRPSIISTLYVPLSSDDHN